MATTTTMLTATGARGENNNRTQMKLAIRKFVFLSYRVYCGSLKHPTIPMQLPLHLLRNSHKFREQLARLFVDIEIIESNAYSSEDGTIAAAGGVSLQHEYELTSAIISTWHLCEVFFLSSPNNVSIDAVVWLQMNGSPTIPFNAALNKFKNIRNPQFALLASSSSSSSLYSSSSSSSSSSEMDSGDEYLIGYWDTVYGLAMEGRLVEMWDILALHGEIVGLVTGSTGALQAAAPAGGSTVDGDRLTLKALFDVFSSHPFAKIIQQRVAAVGTAAEEDPNAINAIALALDFKNWQGKVSHLLDDNAPLFSRIPEFGTILLILIGDKDTLVQRSFGDWTALAVAMLLYSYPPPLSRMSLNKVIDAAMELLPLPSNLTMEERSKETTLRATIREVMHGDVSRVLKHLVELSGWGRPMDDPCSLFGLLSVAHLTHLLARAGRAGGQDAHPGVEVLADLLLGDSSCPRGSAVPNPLSATLPNEASFVEELFLECACRLNELDFPLDVVAGYLRSCPLRGKEYARKLLPRRPAGSDKAVGELAAALRGFELWDEARAVECARGAWWLQRSRVRGWRLSDSAGGVTSEGSDPSLADPTGHEVCKALRFFQLADDGRRCAALLDRGLWRCCAAVTLASQALHAEELQRRSPSGAPTASSLAVAAVFPLLPRTLKLEPTAPRGAAVRGEETVADFWDMRHYPEAERLGQGGGPPARLPSAAVAARRLLAAIAQAEQLLSAVTRKETKDSPEAVCLESYASMARALVVSPTAFQSVGPSVAGMGLTQLLVGVAESDWHLLGGGRRDLDSDAEANGTGTSTSVLFASAKTILMLITEQLVPVRFWLHLIDLAVGLDRLLDKAVRACLFRQEATCDLMAAAERALLTHEHYAQGSRSAPVQVAPIAPADARVLRLGLLGMFTSAVLQANADDGAARAKADELERRNNEEEYVRHRDLRDGQMKIDDVVDLPVSVRASLGASAASVS